MRILTDPAETGAVTVSLPQDVQTEAFDFPTRFFEPRAWPIRRALADPAAVAHVVRLLAGAQRPAIIAGGGIHFSEAWAELREFSDAFGIPVAETFAGKGALLEASELGLGGVGVEGNPAANAVLREADLVICIGTRLGDFITASRSLFQASAVRFVGINVAAHDATKLGALAVVADARETLIALTDAGRKAGIRPDPGYVADVRNRSEAWAGQLAQHVAPADGLMTQGRLIRVLGEGAQRGDIIVAAAGSPVGDLLKQWPHIRLLGGLQLFEGVQNGLHMLHLRRGGQLHTPGGIEHIQADGVALLDHHVRQRGGEQLGIFQLVRAAFAILHGARTIKEQMPDEVGFLLVLLDGVAFGTPVGFPIDVPDVIPGHILTVLHELDGEATIGRLVIADAQPLDDGAGLKSQRFGAAQHIGLQVLRHGVTDLWDGEQGNTSPDLSQAVSAETSRAGGAASPARLTITTTLFSTAVR